MFPRYMGLEAFSFALTVPSAGSFKAPASPQVTLECQCRAEVVRHQTTHGSVHLLPIRPTPTPVALFAGLFRGAGFPLATFLAALFATRFDACLFLLFGSEETHHFLHLQTPGTVPLYLIVDLSQAFKLLLALAKQQAKLQVDSLAQQRTKLFSESIVGLRRSVEHR